MKKVFLILCLGLMFVPNASAVSKPYSSYEVAFLCNFTKIEAKKTPGVRVLSCRKTKPKNVVLLAINPKGIKSKIVWTKLDNSRNRLEGYINNELILTLVYPQIPTKQVS